MLVDCKGLCGSNYGLDHLRPKLAKEHFVGNWLPMGRNDGLS